VYTGVCLRAKIVNTVNGVDSQNNYRT